ncbi:MAG: TetR/AcrR family transcriptional regulator [Hymenobacteraceae bacterium]|nr:TetR/AcrR family transcriptional regulator [Hymenobacteraceae bacterium]
MPLPSPTTPATAAPLDTRRRILDEAEALLLARGFQAFSYQHIARALGVKPAAIHYHFPTKEDLGVALLQRQAGRLAKWRALPRVADLSPAGRFGALLDVYFGRLGQAGQLCFFGALAPGFDVLADPMRAELRRFTAALTGWLTEVLAEGRATGELRFVGAPAAKAAQVLTMLAGALQVARVYDVQQFDLIIGQLVTELVPGGLPPKPAPAA